MPSFASRPLYSRVQGTWVASNWHSYGRATTLLGPEMGAAKMWGLSLQSWACGGENLGQAPSAPPLSWGHPFRLTHVLTSLFPA